MTDLARYYDESYPPSLWAPASTVASINPNTAAVGAAPFTITVTGTGFTDDSVISFDGDVRTTTFVSATQLTAPIGSPVAPARTVTVSVDSGGSRPFTITAAAEEPAGAATGAAGAPEAPTAPAGAEPSPEGPTGADAGPFTATPVAQPTEPTNEG